MQPLDALTLSYLAAELDVKLADGKINKIQQASHYEILLHLWVGGDASRQKFYINIRPEHAFCSLISDTSFLTFPEKAPNFCMVLRKHLTSARIQQIFTLPDERVLNFRLDNYNELGQRVQLVLSIELMGKNSNIILYDEELNLILGCAHGVSEQMSRLREISVGYPYVPPPASPLPPLRCIGKDNFLNIVRQAGQQQAAPEEMLLQYYSGLGKAVLRDVFATASSDEAAYHLLRGLFEGDALYPTVHVDRQAFSLIGLHQGDTQWQPMPNISTMVQTAFLHHFHQERFQRMKHQLAQVLKTQEKKLEKRQTELQRSDEQAIQQLKRCGDLLTIAASQGLQISGKILELQDETSQSKVSVAIDPALSLIENAQQYYRRYKKGQARAQMAEKQASQLRDQTAFYQELHRVLAQAETVEDLLALREDFVAQGWMKPLEDRKKGLRKPLPQVMTLTSSDGFTILVGKSSLQNDWIVGKLSRPEDLWFHAHLIPGSHIVVRTEKRSVPNRTLEEAAMLAAYFSQARDSVNIPVVYTEARYVRKIPNSYPGHVTYTHEQAINITPDKAWLGQKLSEQPVLS